MNSAERTPGARRADEAAPENSGRAAAPRHRSDGDPFDDFMADPDEREDGRMHEEPVEVARPTTTDAPEQVEEEAEALPAAKAELTEPSEGRRRLTRRAAAALLLIAAPWVACWQVYALGAERDALERELQRATEAREQAQLSARQAKVQLARYIENSDARRAVELERDAQTAPQQELAADCVTPRSILLSSGL